MRLPRAVPPVRPEDTLRARTAARRARFLGPLPQLALVAVLFVAVALAWLDRTAGVTYVGLVAGALAVGFFIGGMFGPLTGRRRWLLGVAEGAAAAHQLLHPDDRPWADAAGGVGAGGVDEAIDTVLRLEGAAPFLLRRGERAWLRATTALLIQTDPRSGGGWP